MSKPPSSRPGKAPRKAPFPSREDILRFIQENPRRVGRREIAGAFRLDAGQKRTLKKVLRDLELDGALEGRGRRRGRRDGKLPAVAVVEIIGTDFDGELKARPLAWDGDDEPPSIYMAPERRGRPALGTGDRALARLSANADGTYEGRTIRRIGGGEASHQILGIYESGEGGGRLRSTDRRSKGDYAVEKRYSMGARPGDLVRAEPLPGRRLGLRPARVVERLGGGKGPAGPSMIAIADHDLPTRFSDDAEAQAAAAGPAPAEARDDLRPLPLVTIDGSDARDFDDAVWAEPDPDKRNPGGWHLVVAIADVAWYVRPGDALDRCAYERGNSVYFPDRVVPMLPEALSNGWCSLVPAEDRPCVAADLWIDAEGMLIRHRFRRGLMRSQARLTYEQVQAARDGRPDKTAKRLMDEAIMPLYGAFKALMRNRVKRAVLDLDMPERRIVLAADGSVEGIETRQRLDSHRLIEEFMIAANVAAAETLDKRRIAAIYRVHDQPPPDKLDALRQVLESIGIHFTKGGVATPRRFNQVLKKAAGTAHAPMVNEMVLRTQARAEYGPENLGHFGLALRRYCHFTSPIRRYSDLLVHRALIGGSGLGAGGPGGSGSELGDLAEIGVHLSATERRAAVAERDALDRFTAGFLAARIGARFEGRINGVTRFGLFVTLNETGADGLIPIRTLADDYYHLDEARHSLRGRSSGREYRLGDAVEVRLAEASPITGGMVFSLMDSGSPAGVRGRARVKTRARKGHAAGKPAKGRRRSRGRGRS